MVHHKYLVSLLGYRCTRDQQILVYEYMRGGDLRERLQGVFEIIRHIFHDDSLFILIEIILSDKQVDNVVV